MAFDVSTITVDTFKTFFAREPFVFNTIPAWNSSINYITGNQVYIYSNFSKYTALSDNVDVNPVENPAIWEFNNQVNKNDCFNEDIEEVLNDAKKNYSKKLFTEDSDAKKAILYLSAHYLTLKIDPNFTSNTSSQNGVLVSKSVGNVSAAYLIKSKYTSLSQQYLTSTKYGKEYSSMVELYSIGLMLNFKNSY